MAEGRSKLFDKIENQFSVSGSARPDRSDDSPVSVDTTEKLGAEVHVVEVAKEGNKRLVHANFEDHRKMRNSTHSTTWSQLMTEIAEWSGTIVSDSVQLAEE